jgi:hypothetical protein
MRLLVLGLLCSALSSGAWGQSYARNWGYADLGYRSFPSYYLAYSDPRMTVVYPQPAPVPQVVVVNESPAAQTRQIMYLIAFKDSVIRPAVAYWVSGNILNYFTWDHERRTAPLDSVDRALSERLNSEQNVPFYLPAEHKEAELRERLEQ